MKAALLLQSAPAFRIEAFRAGLAAHGFSVSSHASVDPKPEDVLVVWNRNGIRDSAAKQYEKAGARVIVAENGYLGREWRGSYWYALSLGHHNGAGVWPDGGAERWDRLEVEIQPWRDGGDEIVILAQRGIGERGISQPQEWALKAKQALRGQQRKTRVREHPGERGKPVSLEHDLAKAWACVTWSSGAALKALLMGVPVFYGFPQWIGASAARPFGTPLGEPFRGDRLPMFRRLAWAMWPVDQIASGEAFQCLFR